MRQDEERCRFNCRNAKENWIEGYVYSCFLHFAFDKTHRNHLEKEAEKEYQKWKNREKL